MASVVLEDVTKLFPGPAGRSVRAAHRVCLAVEDKELLVLVGPSGCGKTTLLRLIAGLEEPTEGTIWLDGRVINHTPPQDRDLALVFQHHALYPHLTAFDNMALGLRLRRVPRHEVQSRVAEMAELIGLADCLERRPGELSGGQRQRVALGRALVRRPKVLLLDEPLSNLDAPLRAQMRAEISRLQRRLDTTMIYVTHDQVEAMALGDRIAVMREGVIQQAGAPLEVYERPANLFVGGFVGSPPMNLVEGVVVRGEEGLRLEVQGGATPLALAMDGESAHRLRDRCGRRLVLGIRPEDIVSAGGATGRGPAGTVEAVVASVEFLGAESHLHVVACGHRWVLRRGGRCGGPEPGQTITLAFNLRRAHFFDADTGRALV